MLKKSHQIHQPVFALIKRNNPYTLIKKSNIVAIFDRSGIIPHKI